MYIHCNVCRVLFEPDHRVFLNQLNTLSLRTGTAIPSRPTSLFMNRIICKKSSQHSSYMVKKINISGTIGGIVVFSCKCEHL